MENKLKAGISIVDISPKQGIRLAGYPHYDRANTGIHDSLYASCMYLDNGKNKIAIVAMDILKYPKKQVYGMEICLYIKVGSIIGRYQRKR
jgi:exopolysaccharide biosynthesis predicted pyruvyltransferase EpsI